MAIIDSIPEIQQMLIESSVATVKFNLTGIPVDGRYPSAKIVINQILMWQDIIIDEIELEFKNLNLEGHSVNIELHYTNKSNLDTKIIDDKIVANQCIQINWIEINQLKLSDYFLRDISSTDYDLTEQAKNAYNAIGASWTDVKTTTLYDNGFWNLILERPIVTALLQKKISTNHIFETPHLDVLSKLQQYYKET